MYRSLFSRDVFAELERLQRGLQQTFDVSPSIRGPSLGYPAMNVGTTPQSVEVYCFAPGIDPNSIDVNLEKGVLTIVGERKATLPAEGDEVNLHIDERFVGKFRRVVALSDDVDPDAVQASYRDGVLHVSVQRKKASQPKRITIQ